ncbi:hypothetical protein AMEX_G19041 [Astyanax mexicanus]|uniref:Uncharacterized protein n=1 Tax=Astyanax mexicanus TaxID=7994 RepID=A0A8T2LAV2_ASTMX|nr:hypothetical protein AMEX_G19041 [Astyanax mexicanus]
MGENYPAVKCQALFHFFLPPHLLQFGPAGCLGVGCAPASYIQQDLLGSSWRIPGPTTGTTPKTNFT